jgi:hypothetical protein
MAASYPTSTKSFTTKVDGNTISASHPNDLQDEVVAIEVGLRDGLAHDLKFTDATYDIGKSGATRPRDIFLSRNAVIGGTLAVTGVATLTAQAVLTAAFQTGAAIAYVNDTANANMTVGLTLNQGANDDEILAMKSSDVAHGVTTIAETDTYGACKKDVAASGGLLIDGLSEGIVALRLRGIATTVDTTHTAAGEAPVTITANLASGTGVADVSADGNLFAIRNSATGTRFIVDEDGDTFQDGTAGTAYSDYDDPMLALAVEHEINPKAVVRETFARYCQYNKQSLVDAGILAPDGPKGERGFVNMSALTRLAIGGLWQLAIEQKRLKAALVERGLIPA